MSLILASASPQRSTLLAQLGIPFEVIPSDVQEDDHPESDPLQRSIDLARLKAQDIAKKHPGSVVIGCDTLVVSSKGELLEKPTSEKDARRMIGLQSGNSSVVHSAVCVIDAKGNAHEAVSSSNVTFKKLSDQELDWWMKTGLWKDRSGSFQIDGPGQLMIERIEGDWTGIVGLPVFVLGKLLEEAGVSLKKMESGR